MEGNLLRILESKMALRNPQNWQRWRSPLQHNPLCGRTLTAPTAQLKYCICSWCIAKTVENVLSLLADK
jgi:hypothetical protein